MKKATKRVIALKEKDESLANQTKWEVMFLAPNISGGFETVQVVADGYSLDGDEDCIVFWKGASFDDSNEVAIFKEWIYAIKKP